MTIKNELITHLQEANKSLTNLVNFQQQVIAVIMSIYRKHITKLLQLSNFKVEDHHEAQYKGKIMQQTAMINDMLEVMKKAIAIDSEEPIIFIQELARLQKENKDLREILNIANQFGSFSLSNDIETQTIEENTDCLIEETKTNDISYDDLSIDSGNEIRRSSVLVQNDELFIKQLNDESISLKSSEIVEPTAEIITNENSHSVETLLSELRHNNLIVN
ncbi:hypothetical protein O3M35_004956 [Rhynocoris fuscipes]|uniref:Uncharacterized protein n=1 Tax=Rhynocoris fuscipes TaxID=488301 RepID=A0AAW1DHB0_9HEMI